MSSEQIKQALYNSDQMKAFTEEKGNRKGNRKHIFICISENSRKLCIWIKIILVANDRNSTQTTLSKNGKCIDSQV